MFAIMKPYVPTPPPGAQPPPLWGDDHHVRTLFADRVTDLETRQQTLTVDRFATPEAFRDYFKAYYGPTIATYRGIAEQPTRIATLDTQLADLARRHDRGDASTILDWEYQLLTARKNNRER